MIARVSDWPELELVCMIYSVVAGGQKCTESDLFVKQLHNWSWTEFKSQPAAGMVNSLPEITIPAYNITI